MHPESLLWLIPAAPLVGFLLNGWLVGPRLQRIALGQPASAGGHGHGGHDHGHGGHDHGHGGHDHGHGAHDHGAHDHDHGGHGGGHHGPANVGPLAAIGAIAVAGPLIAFVLSVLSVLQVPNGALHQVLWSWFQTGGLDVSFGLQVDALTGVMLLFVTGIGTLIHLYSFGYMHHDPGFYRFVSYLNLFMFSMLCLILGDSLLVLFLGWEGVGLCSYLLIGYWFEDLANVDAGRKAFVVNRIGDFAFIVGMFTLFGLAGGLDYATLEAAIANANPASIVPAGPFAGWTLGAVLTLAAGSLFVGATGKSAQIPLYVWLPDAMAGPTPVSALIHAATMVTAGVYLIARLDFLFALTPLVTQTIGVVAACTALLAALIAFAQYDIKKVLAYSTVSQLGFMFAGMSTTFWVSGLFHVITHAFFKALLFLGAGAIIHALDNEQDVRKMGGLWKDMRVESILFLIGSAALAGVPGLAGFWSKDEVIGNVFVLAQVQGGSWWFVFGVLLLTAGLTAFYTTRLVMLTFFGAPHDPHRHPHKTHWTMLVPLIVLATLSVVGGLALGSPVSHLLATFTEPIWTVPAWHHEIDHALEHSAHQTAMALSIVVALGGIGLSAFLYSSKRALLADFVAGAGKPLFQAASNKFYVDELYDLVVVRPTAWLARALFVVIDRGAIDGVLVTGSALGASGLGVVLRRVHTGVLNAATTAMALGAVVILAYLGWQVANG